MNQSVFDGMGVGIKGAILFLGWSIVLKLKRKSKL